MVLNYKVLAGVLIGAFVWNQLEIAKLKQSLKETDIWVEGVSDVLERHLDAEFQNEVDARFVELVERYEDDS